MKKLPGSDKDCSEVAYSSEGGRVPCKEMGENIILTVGRDSNRFIKLHLALNACNSPCTMTHHKAHVG